MLDSMLTTEIQQDTHTRLGGGLETITSFLSLSQRLEVIAADLESCRNQALDLRIEDYWDDYIL
jgi:hypothetical protein